MVAWGWISRRAQGMIGKSPLAGMMRGRTRRYEKEAQVAVKFDDVAGLEAAKRDLSEISEFLKEPERFRRLGGKVRAGSCSWARLARARRCWRAPWPVRPAFRSSPSAHLSSSRCSWASAPLASELCSRMRRRFRRRSSSSTRSTPSVGRAARAWAGATTSASRRSINCYQRWTASRGTTSR